MLRLYRSLLYLYPSAYRCEFADEMMLVLFEVQKEIGKYNVLKRIAYEGREAAGLLCGALHEHLRMITSSYGMFPPRRIRMRSEFRFPKAAVGLMTLILIAVLMTIDKAKSIQSSVPYANPQIGPIKPEEFTLLPTLLVVLVGACLAGAIAWGILFALRRSGIHRLAEVNPSNHQQSGN
jgi:hypothetical protein